MHESLNVEDFYIQKLWRFSAVLRNIKELKMRQLWDSGFRYYLQNPESHFSYLLCGGDGFVDELGQGDGDIVVDQPVGQSVILRASHVHNGNRHSRLCGHRHDACRGHDFQCGSDDPQFIGLRREAIRFFERAVRQCLAEIDHVGFDESVAWHIAAIWQSAMTVWVWFVVEIRHDVGGVVFRMAFHAVRSADGAMQIDDDVAAIACFFVQRVEILCGEQCEQSSLFQFDERLVRGARLRVPYGRFLLPTPGIHAVFFIGEECVDVIHFRLFRMLGPDTVRSAEVGNTCGRGNPRPRQYCDLFAHVLGIPRFIPSMLIADTALTAFSDVFWAVMELAMQFALRLSVGDASFGVCFWFTWSLFSCSRLAVRPFGGRFRHAEGLLCFQRFPAVSACQGCVGGRFRVN